MLPYLWFMEVTYPMGYDLVTSLEYHTMYFRLFVNVCKALFQLCLNVLIYTCTLISTVCILICPHFCGYCYSSCQVSKKKRLPVGEEFVYSTTSLVPCVSHLSSKADATIIVFFFPLAPFHCSDAEVSGHRPLILLEMSIAENTDGGCSMRMEGGITGLERLIQYLLCLTGN